MGLAQDVQAAVTRYEDAARTAALGAHDLAATVAGLAEQLSARGPLGATSDPDLVRARSLLTTAGTRLVAAVEAAGASHDRARQYADRAFPV
jgi:hypothetical protein